MNTPSHTPDHHKSSPATGFRTGVAAVLAASTITAVANEANAQSCFVMGDLDNGVVSALGGCQGDVIPDRFSVGATGVVAQPLIPQFAPNIEVDLSATSIINQQWIVGTSLGVGGYWADPQMAGYASASGYFTGTMPVAPFASSLGLFYPKDWGTPNENNMLFRQRFGVKVGMPENSALTAGMQLLWPNVRNPEALNVGAFASVIKSF